MGIDSYMTSVEHWLPTLQIEFNTALNCYENGLLLVNGKLSSFQLMNFFMESTEFSQFKHNFIIITSIKLDDFIRFLLFDVKWIKMIRLLTSWIVLSGFFDDIFRNRSCAWQNLPVFLSNFFLCSLTPPIRSLRKVSNGTTICSWACANWNWNSMDILVRDLNGFNKIIIFGWFEWKY